MKEIGSSEFLSEDSWYSTCHHDSKNRVSWVRISAPTYFFFWHLFTGVTVNSFLQFLSPCVRVKLKYTSATRSSSKNDNLHKLRRNTWLACGCALSALQVDAGRGAAAVAAHRCPRQRRSRHDRLATTACSARRMKTRHARLHTSTAAARAPWWNAHMLPFDTKSWQGTGFQPRRHALALLPLTFLTPGNSLAGSNLRSVLVDWCYTKVFHEQDPQQIIIIKKKSGMSRTSFSAGKCWEGRYGDRCKTSRCS